MTLHTRAGWYQRLFAWALAHGMGRYQEVVAARKQRLFSNVNGNVLEIGPGTGANLVYFPSHIRWIGVEPNPFMHRYLQEEAQRIGLTVNMRIGTAEQVGAEDDSVDVVVSTLVLCSVLDLDAVLREVLRVLRPGGRFLFMEHVAAPSGTRLRRIQHAVKPFWKLIGDGCRPDRETWTALESAGFESVQLEHFHVPFPIIGPHIMGEAIKGTGSGTRSIENDRISLGGISMVALTSPGKPPNISCLG